MTPESAYECFIEAIIKCETREEAGAIILDIEQHYEEYRSEDLT